jgi:hypothetical protein
MSGSKKRKHHNACNSNQKRKYNCDHGDSGTITPKFGFCVNNKKIPLKTHKYFEFFSAFDDSTEHCFLCFDQTTHKGTVECKSILIDLPLQFIAICNNKLPKKLILYKLSYKWNIALDWLGANEVIMQRFKNALLPSYDSWKDFHIRVKDPDLALIRSDDHFAIEHDHGEDFGDPEPCLDFAETRNIPTALLDIVHENNCIIAGGACVPFGMWPSSDVDIFVLKNENSDATVNRLVACLEQTHKIRKLSQAVLTCIGFQIPPYRNIQIITSSKSTPLDVLRGFDMDCIRLYFDGKVMHKTILCRFTLQKKICSYPNETMIFNAKRLAKYHVKGFLLTSKEIECVKFTLGEWPLSEQTVNKMKYDFPTFNHGLSKIEQDMQWFKYGLIELEEGNLDMIPFEGYETKRQEIHEPNQFRGSIEEYVKMLQLSVSKNGFADYNDVLYSIKICNLHVVMFENFPQNFEYSANNIHSTNPRELTFPLKPKTFKMQTSKPAVYASMHNAIVNQCRQSALLRSPERFKGKSCFLKKKYHDILLNFGNAKVYLKNRFLQNEMEGLPLDSKMHVVASPTFVNAKVGSITWTVHQVFLIG